MLHVYCICLAVDYYLQLGVIRLLVSCFFLPKNSCVSLNHVNAGAIIKGFPQKDCGPFSLNNRFHERNSDHPEFLIFSMVENFF